MKKLLSILALGALAATAANAQLVARYYSAGSSAQFNTFALAAANPISGGAICGTNHWTKKNGASLADPRPAAPNPILNETGNIWVVWNNAAAASPIGANAIVCYYVSLDSIVGLREYFANATLNLPAAEVGTGDDALVPYIGGTAVALPATIQALINGTKLNSANTDIRPEDAKFASNRALTAYGAFMLGRGFTGVGFQGPANEKYLGQPIYSSQSTAQANPVDWAFEPGDTDPITGAAPRVFLELNIGAAPVLVFANFNNTAAGHIGDPGLNLTNVNKYVLSNALIGKLSHVRDLADVSSYPNDAPLHVWIREELSGTYNTMDFNIPNANDIAGDYLQGAGRVTGQETNIAQPENPACLGLTPCQNGPTFGGNPLFQSVGSNGSTRGRVVGTGEMISTVNSIALNNLSSDSLGYAFWGYSSFAGIKANHLKYLFVDGVDPLYSAINVNSGGTGALPQCPATPCILPFDNIKNGSYPIWSKYRAVWDPSDNLNIAPNLTGLAQTASTTLYSDFVPFTSLNVFRSHFAQVVTTNGGGISPNNGLKTGVPETGGDMGGFVFTNQSEQDFITDTGGSQQTDLKQ